MSFCVIATPYVIDGDPDSNGMAFVTFRVGGVIRHIFDYGDVLIQTAGTAPNFDFLAVPKPAFVADKIGDLAREKGGEENESREPA